MEERRLNTRRQTALTGRIIIDKRAATIECMVRDLSDDGAKIDVREMAHLPYEFKLEISDVNFSVRTRVAWASGKSYGLVFIEAPQMIQDNGSSAQPTESTQDPDVSTRSLTLNLSEAQYERLRRSAFERRLSYQELVERALRAYLDQ
jgi:predicted DNA binding CopG/RHH family protein